MQILKNVNRKRKTTLPVIQKISMVWIRGRRTSVCRASDTGRVWNQISKGNRGKIWPRGFAEAVGRKPAELN